MVSCVVVGSLSVAPLPPSHPCPLPCPSLPSSPRDLFGLNELPLRALYARAEDLADRVRYHRYLVSRRRAGEPAVRTEAPQLAETIHLVAYLNVQVGEGGTGGLAGRSGPPAP